MRKPLILAGALVAALVLAEGGARVWLWARGGAWDGVAAARAVEEARIAMTGVLPEAVVGGGAGPENGEETGGGRQNGRGLRYVPHPYSGFTVDANLRVVEDAVEYFGGEPSEFSVLVLGGSVAALFAGLDSGGMDRLADRLEADPRLEGRSVRVFRGAIPGFKQPQQLAVLAYLLSRGCRPDLVLNLDGLNEVRLGPRNAQLGVQTTWPAIGHWARATAWDAVDPRGVELLVDVGVAQRRGRALVERAQRLGLARSAILGRWTLSRLAHARAEWAAAQERYVAHVVESRAQGEGRPFGIPPRKQGALEEAVDCWFHSSLAMHHLCEPLGIRYVHALQPTLHDEGSKPLTEEERRRGIGDRGLDPRVVGGYPLLREACRRLQALGVHCLDLSGAFAGVEETLYYDSCHFRRPGNELLAERLVAALDGVL